MLIKIAIIICIICTTVRFVASLADYFNDKKYCGANLAIALIEMLAMVVVANFIGG